MPTNYIYTVDLRNQDTTPSYVVSYPDPSNPGSTLSYPANTMPHLVKDDTLVFVYVTDSNTMVLASQLNVRALVSAESNSPFSSTVPPDGLVYDILKPGQILTVIRVNGHWSFSIFGSLAVPNRANDRATNPTISIPFYIDPDMDVGTGVPP